VEIGVDSLFDVQVKRIHEYKRQLLNLIHVVSRYIRILEEPRERVVPRTVLFAGKAAPGYAMAKSVIRLINNVARTINGDEALAQASGGVPAGLRCVARPKIMPARGSVAADIHGRDGSLGHRQHETRALGSAHDRTLDGANIEIRDHVGADNIFIFGMTADEAAAKRAAGYQPWRELEGIRARRGVGPDRIGAFFQGGVADAQAVGQAAQERGGALPRAGRFAPIRPLNAAWTNCTTRRTNGAARRCSIA